MKTEKEVVPHLELHDPGYPLCIKIIKSGWHDYYHVIQEDPENGDFDHTHEFLHKDKVQLRYNIRL